MTTHLQCIRCGNIIQSGTVFRCKCGGLYEVVYNNELIKKNLFDHRIISSEAPYDSGVWRFKELISPDIDMRELVSRPEGNTNIYRRRNVSYYTGIDKLSLKHEGENPTGSFKDRGMTVAVSEAMRLKSTAVACASTGNTSASMAAYAAQAGLKGIVFIPEGEIAYGKLSQAIAFGAKVIQVKGNFDDAMKLVEAASQKLGLYLLNSINPWRIEGQKSIIFELLQQRKWVEPDWIIVPAGNLGNTSAFGKALLDLKKNGLIKKIPRIAAIQAEGANPFYNLFKSGINEIVQVDPHTVASAIKIGNPVSWERAIRVIRYTNGVVEQVSDQEIMEAKAEIDRCGIGCEPASAASVAGARKLREVGVIDFDSDVVCVLTGTLLKDSETTIRYHMGELEGILTKNGNKPTSIDPSEGDIMQSLRKLIVSTD